MNNLPIYFKLPNGIRGEVGDWLKENDLLKSITYDWVTGMLAFELHADATALSIKFGIYPTRTTLDLMLEHEESNN